MFGCGSVVRFRPCVLLGITWFLAIASSLVAGIFTGVRPALAGSYTVSYSGGTWTATPPGRLPNGSPGPTSGPYTLSGGTYGATADPGGSDGDATCSGGITATFTWVPSYPGEPAPDKVRVTQTVRAVFYGQTNGQNQVDDGLGDTPTYSVSPMGLTQGAASGSTTTVVGGGPTVTVTCSPVASTLSATQLPSGVYASVTYQASVEVPDVDPGRHNGGDGSWLDGVKNFLSSDPTYDRWLPLSFSPTVTSQPFRRTAGSPLTTPWGNMSCAYSLHMVGELDTDDLLGGGMAYWPTTGEPAYSTAPHGSLMFQRAIVDANGDQLELTPSTGSGFVQASAFADIFSVIGTDSGTGNLSILHAGPPGALKQRGGSLPTPSAAAGCRASRTPTATSRPSPTAAART